jgi:adenylate cyclase
VAQRGQTWYATVESSRSGFLVPLSSASSPRVRHLTPILCGLAAGVLMVVSHLTGALNRLELAAIDLEYRITDRLDASRVAIVGVDDKTLQELNRRPPLRRYLHAHLVRRLRRDYHPSAIVYDFQFTEHSEYLADDFELARALRAARPVVLATTGVLKGGGNLVLGGHGADRRVGAVVGNANLVADSDGVIRRLRLELQGIPTLAAAGAAVASGRAPPKDPGDDRWINFAGPAGSVTEYPFIDVLKRRVPRAALANKVDVVGPVAATFQDLHATGAGGAPMTGAELVANMINTVRQDKPLREVWLPFGILFILLAGVLAGVPYANVIPWAAGWRLSLGLRLLLLALTAGLVVMSLRRSFSDEVILPAADSMGAFVLGSILAGVLSLTSAVHERRLAEVRARFGRFVPQQVVERLLATADGSGRLEGVEVTATVLFADIRGFTASVERRPASEVIAILDRYLASMSESVMAHGGTVVSYSGDGIMAVFGAPLTQPDHADRALRAARDMLDSAAPSVNRWLVEQRMDVPPIRIGIGLHSGPVASGTVGSERRLEYAVVGDTTNTASRIESMTKELGVPLLVSAATEDHLSPGLRDGLAEVGVFPLRGRQARVRLSTWRSPEPSPTDSAAASASRV